MSFSNFLKELLPPILVKSIHHLKRRFSFSPPKPQLEYLPGSWDSEFAKINPLGWNQDSVIQTAVERWHIFAKNLNGNGPLGFTHESTELHHIRNLWCHNLNMVFGYVLALTALQKQKISILDWGGGLGQYYLLSKAFFPKLEIEFHCMEVPLMCKAGGKLCPDIQFHSDESCLKQSYDLIQVNGSLGYFQDWKSLIHKLAKSVSGYLYLSRVITIDNHPGFIILQRSDHLHYFSEMITQAFNRTELLNTFQQTGLMMVREFELGSHHSIHNGPDGYDGCWLFKKA